MALARLASAVGFATRSAAAQQACRQLRPASLLPLIAAPSRQAARGVASVAGAPLPPRHRCGTRVFSSLDSPHYDDSKHRVNVYSNYTVYKGKSAMSLKVIKPTWEQVGNGGLKVAREGTVLVEFAAAQGPRQYDWEKKETFALSAVECAAVLEGVDSRQLCEFFHDPNKGQPGEGSITKSLKVTPVDKGWFFSIAVNQGGAKSSISCPLSDAELRLVKTLVTFLMPRLLGFDEYFAGAPVVLESSGAAAGGEAGGAPF